MPRATVGLFCSVRPMVEWLVLLLLAGLACRTWGVEGLFGSCPVASGSMAETLLGVHREVTCADCGHRFVCGADLRPVSPQAVCPNCGYSANDLAAQADVAGDRVLIDKTAFWFRSPRRWEVVAFRLPEQADQTAVKRVVGLPGESVDIRHGDVFIDGQIVRKPLALQRALAILVHEADCRTAVAPTPPPRWRGDGQSRWSWAEGRFVHPPDAVEVADTDWLLYHHAGRVAGRAGQVREGPVTDLCGYNQTRPRRVEDVRPVADLLLSVRLVECTGQGHFWLRAMDGANAFGVRLDPRQGRWEVFREGQAERVAVGQARPASDGMSLELSLFDGQFLLAFDGRPALALPRIVPEPPPVPPSQPLALGCEGGLGVELRDLRVYRDVYYTSPSGAMRPHNIAAPYRLGEGQYFVLGDNSPISEDSRTWSRSPAVGSNLLVGKPFVVIFPARHVAWGRWEFQVPDLGRIRYIR